MIRFAALVFAGLLAGPAMACRLALAMALDVSGSVDQLEYRQQMDGLAQALIDDSVQSAIFAVPDVPVAIAIYEWSSSKYQRQIVGWRLMQSPEDLHQLVGLLTSWERAPSPEATGLGAALEYGRDLLQTNPGCWQETLDIAGDGKNNDWPVPRDLRRSGKLANMRINALVIGRDAQGQGHISPPEVGELAAYFHAEIVQGPNAFVEVALGYQDYARAMKRKLLRELATRPIGSPSPLPSIRRRFARHEADQ